MLATILAKLHALVLAALSALFATLLALSPSRPLAAPALPGQPVNPICTPKSVPFTIYPRVVMFGDSITQRGHVSGISANGVATFNPPVTASVTIIAGSPVVTYDGGGRAAPAPYVTEPVSAPGLVHASVVSVIDANHFRINVPAQSSGTVEASFGFPAHGSHSQWTFTTSNFGELTGLQGLYPTFRYDEWNDPDRISTFNRSPFVRGGDMGYAGARTIDLLSREDEVKALDPDILVVAVGVNNILSATFQSDIARLVDDFHGWCPTMPIVLGTIRATAAMQAVARPTGGILYDNTLIMALGQTRPWLKLVDLFTPYATSNASGGSLSSIGAMASAGSTMLRVTTGMIAGADVRQSGVRVGQSVVGNGIADATTVIGASGSTIQLSRPATMSGTIRPVFSPVYGLGGAVETGDLDLFNVNYPLGFSGDGLHPSFVGTWRAVPNLKGVLCPLIAGNCAASPDHNVLLDNRGASLLGRAPAANLAGEGRPLHHLGTPAIDSLRGTWMAGGRSIILAGSPDGAAIHPGQCVAGFGLAADSHIVTISGNRIELSASARSAGSLASLTIAPCVSGQVAAGLDIAFAGAASRASYIVSLSRNDETGGNLIRIDAFPGAGTQPERLLIVPASQAPAIGGCAGKWCQLWGEFDPDQNPGWISITAEARERNTFAYGVNYRVQAVQTIMPSGDGVRRIWVHTDCFPFPDNSSGIAPSFTVFWNPAKATANPEIMLRRWDIRVCDPAPPSVWRARSGR